MTDSEIVELYWQRKEIAIEHTKRQYGKLIRSIAFKILGDEEDCDEVENDVYLAAWNSMPDKRPEVLSAYLGKIARQIAIDRYRHRHSEKRKASEYAASLDELEDVVSDDNDLAQQVIDGQLTSSINRFLRTIDERARTIFVGRYFYNDSIEKISQYTGIKEATVKTILFRTRQKLKVQLLSCTE